MGAYSFAGSLFIGEFKTKRVFKASEVKHTSKQASKQTSSQLLKSTKISKTHVSQWSGGSLILELVVASGEFIEDNQF